MPNSNVKLRCWEYVRSELHMDKASASRALALAEANEEDEEDEEDGDERGE